MKATWIGEQLFLQFDCRNTLIPLSVDETKEFEEWAKKRIVQQN